MTDEGFRELANAIIVQAVKDFRCSYPILKKHPDNKAVAAEVKEITEFFCSDYFMLLSDADGPALLNKVKQEIDEKGTKKK